MKIAIAGLVALFLGALVGAAVGVGTGLLWVQVFHTTSFEGYSGMRVFFTFMPIGGVLGALTGGFVLGRAASRQ